ncbi:glycosyltransferase family 4 protein [Nostoc sp. FACHB-152]|uniref:glycosyltransferase family 4 protein n=1 Tax=unclassified Nostoc TaxID=2593658 RepID=UPI0016874672|nr:MULTISPECIES: glycosyltransferase family 1 protein [unclassified Nostoc]MBD2445890.1 glycosyltransferase family 4 protein [Nostoc sp. FACHB-152]MBD2467934.1 glycosyltransferase family 4 protein [Nostoc sp. FACHB-145]
MNTKDNYSSPQLIVNLSILLDKPTGISNYAQNIFPYLKSLNPTLLTAYNYPEFNCYSIPNNLTPAHGTAGHFRRLVWTQFQLPQIYQKLRGHSQSQTSQLLFSPLPEAPLHSNCRFVAMAHDLIPLRFPKRFSPLTLYHNYYIPQVLKQAQHVVCNSQATADDIIDFYQIPASKITPIHLAHDRTHFHYLNLPTRNYFLYIGRQDPYKNLHRLISAFATLPNYQDYELWLAGPTDPRYTPALQMQVKELGITNQVKFLNYVDYQELPIIINGAIALVFPSLWEGFGFPVLEAMACGTPVITSNISSLPEVAGDATILINPYNSAEITAAMQTIASDAQLRSQLSQQGIARANLFSWEKTGNVTAEVLSRYL